MEQRAPQKHHSINTNENRKRLKVNDNPAYNRKYQERRARKLDMRFKLFFIILTLAVTGTLGYLTHQKRSELISKRYEYNDLVNEVLSKELKRDRLKAKLENSIDLNRIQRYAIEDLGMVYTDDKDKNTDKEKMEKVMKKETNGDSDGSNF